MSNRRIHLSPFGLEDVLAEELRDLNFTRRERLFDGEGGAPAFAQNTWLDVETHEFDSISGAARHLRGLQRNWSLHSVGHHRRAQLIRESLPPLKSKPFVFGAPKPSAPLGAWTLLDERTLAYATRTTNPFPDGEVHFAEDKVGPPSRAYLKLWEWFTLEGVRPAPGELCLDLGSSPGGWTWVLDQLGCRVISVDKAPLSPEVSWSKRVEPRTGSAFALQPFAVDWLFSDVICYPGRLLELVRRWRGFAKNMVCTVKFQGETDFAALAEFSKEPNARVRHLSCNRHELTWSSLATER